MDRQQNQRQVVRILLIYERNPNVTYDDARVPCPLRVLTRDAIGVRSDWSSFVRAQRVCFDEAWDFFPEMIPASIWSAAPCIAVRLLGGMYKMLISTDGLMECQGHVDQLIVKLINAAKRDTLDLTIVDPEGNHSYSCTTRPPAASS